MKRRDAFGAGMVLLLLFGLIVPRAALAQGPPDILWMAGGTYMINDVHYSPDGQTFVSASMDLTAKLWRTSDGKLLRTFMDEFGAMDAAYSPNGTMIAVASPSDVRIFRVSDGALLQTLPGQWAAAFSPDSQTVATGGPNNTIDLWQVTLRLWPNHLIRFGVSPNPVQGGESATATLEIGGAAPAGGITYTLKSTVGSVGLPESVTIPAGKSKISFPVTTQEVTQKTGVILTAARDGEIWEITLFVTP